MGGAGSFAPGGRAVAESTRSAATLRLEFNETLALRDAIGRI